MAFALILSGALSGCATFGKCDSDNCRDDAKITSEVQTLLDRHPELPETELSDALQIAEAARNAVVRMRISHAKSPTAPYVSISGGIAVLLHNGNSSAPQLILEADRCLYQAKRLGRNRMVAEAAELREAMA